MRDKMGGGNDNVWSGILSEVRSNASVKMPTGKAIVMLGDNESGKTTLVAKLQGIDDPKKGSGLEYGYIVIRDEYREDSTQLGVWVLDGNPTHSNLLQFALNERTLPNTTVLLTVSMFSPWSIIDQLQTWAALLHDHIDSLNLDPDTVKEMRERNVRRWVEYVEPGDELDLGQKRSSRNLEEEPLGSGVLVRNTGLDVVVVVTKTDCMGQLERESEFREEHFDFVQFHVRRFCLAYGASVFYVSVKEDKNCDLLYKYLVHRVYSLPFRTPALIVEKDAVFIPAGWDNEKKMAILQENMTTIQPDDFYNDVIPRPIAQRKTVNRESEVEVEEEQRFLERQLSILHQSTKAPSAKTTPDPNKRLTPSPLPLTPKKGDSAGADRVLANFFNSLLSKKTGGSPGSTPNTSLNGTDC